MTVINKLVMKTLKLNKKRSIGTIIGIMLSVALVCAVSGMFASLRETLIENEKLYDGDFHFYYSNIDGETVETLKHNRDIENMEITGRIGYCEANDYFVYVDSMEDMENTVVPVRLVNGRYPENEHEIVFDSMALWELGAKVGDTVNLNLGEIEVLEEDEIFKAQIVGAESYEFTIVGEISSRLAYSGYTVGMDNGNYNAYIKFKDSKKYEENIYNILGHDLYEEDTDFYDSSYVNTELLRWENMEFSDDTMRMLYAVIAILIIIILITSVFCIKNSLDISVTEKMKTYGMLASVGATKKQIRKSVLFEGMYLGIIGIPLGVALGELAVFVLCKIVSFLLKDISENGNFYMVFSLPILPIAISVLLGVVTIYLSTFLAAFKAGRVSPIENIRSNKEVRIKGNKLKTPGIITKFFGIGGVIAYKNLKRSRRKYRTTIVSLAVSVFVFIAMSAFITEMKRQTISIYTDFDYNVKISVDADKFTMPREVKEKSKTILCSYDYRSCLQLEDKNRIMYFEDNPEDEMYSEEEKERNNAFVIFLMDEETFARYQKKVGISAEDNTCIICDIFPYRSSETNKVKRVRRTDYNVGDTVSGQVSVYEEYSETDEEEDESYLQIDVTVGGITDINPYGSEQIFYSLPIVVLNEKYYPELKSKYIKYCIETNDAYEVSDLLHDLEGVEMIENLDEIARENRSIVFLMGLFMYGFITVISLIGVTNIFNTITSNMELRQKEFAMLKSIGMTRKEFGRMVNLETLFYSCKALVFGVVSGLIASGFIHKAFNERVEDVFIFPGKAIVLSIIFVFVLVYIIMKYSIAKINKQNTIETIRKDTV
ncbi:MAG: ABC transporter permease [Wujia sp.]